MSKKILIVGTLVGMSVAMAIGVVFIVPVVKYMSYMADWSRATTFAADLFAYSNIHGEFPADVKVFCVEVARARKPSTCDKYSQEYHDFIMRNFLLHAVTIEEFKQGSGYVSAKSQDAERMAKIVNERLQMWFYFQACWVKTGANKKGDGWDGTWYLGDVNHEKEKGVASRLSCPPMHEMSTTIQGDGRLTNIANSASDKNQVMDELLNQPQVPADYGNVMVELYRDKSQDVLTRDFAVQHIGLYAQALSRRGKYVPESEDARNCRAALFDAASETHTIVAAAAFRALADMSEFDSRVDTRRLDSLLASCVADASATPASRAMAVQLCGERRIVASRPALEKAASDPAASEVVRRSAKYALSLIDAR